LNALLRDRIVAGDFHDEVAQRRTVARHHHREVESVDPLERTQPLGRVAAERERDRVHNEITDEQNLFIRHVDERVAGRDRALVVQHFDVAFTELDVQAIGERYVWKRVADARLLVERGTILVEDKKMGRTVIRPLRKGKLRKFECDQFR